MNVEEVSPADKNSWTLQLMYFSIYIDLRECFFELQYEIFNFYQCVFR